MAAYNGNWFNGKQHGDGYQITPGDQKVNIKKGRWKNGKIIPLLDLNASREEIRQQTEMYNKMKELYKSLQRKVDEHK